MWAAVTTNATTLHSVPVELSAPDIMAYRRGNVGIDYVTRFDSGRSGPHVVITALVHGNEISGAIALDSLLRFGLKPLRGCLTLLFANTAAYAEFSPRRPYASRCVDEDFNRLWSSDILDSRRDSCELRRARAIRPVIDSADLLLDLHSMATDTDPMILCGQSTRGLALAEQLGKPSWIVADHGHVSGPRLIDYQRFITPGDASTAILVECGQHWRQTTAATALNCCLRFLALSGTISPSLAPAARLKPADQRRVEVTHVVTAETNDFVFSDAYEGLQIVPQAGTILGHDGTWPIVTPYDDCVLIMPVRRPRAGQTAVRLGRLLAAG